MARRVVRPWYTRPVGLLLALLPALIAVRLMLPAVAGRAVRQELARAGLYEVGFRGVRVSMLRSTFAFTGVTVGGGDGPALAADRVEVRLGWDFHRNQPTLRLSLTAPRWRPRGAGGGLAAPLAALGRIPRARVERVEVSRGEVYAPDAQWAWLARVDATVVRDRSNPDAFVVDGEGAVMGDGAWRFHVSVPSVARGEAAGRFTATAVRAASLDAYLGLPPGGGASGTVALEGAFEAHSDRVGAAVRAGAVDARLPDDLAGLIAAERRAFASVVPEAAIQRLPAEAASPAAGTAATLTGTVPVCDGCLPAAVLGAARAIVVEGVAAALERAAAATQASTVAGDL
jgi:hypothetical protein